MPSVSIADQFTDPLGQFENYDAYAVADRDAIRGLKHVDIRSFRQEDITRRLTIFDLNLFTMDELDALTMGDLDDLSTTVLAGEHWTAGTIGPQADLNNWNGLSLTLATGVNTTASVMPNNPVDISGLASSDVLSIALPDFPLSSITTASSYFDLTSNPDGDFTVGPTASVAFNTSAVALVNGDSELRVPISTITGIDLSKITAVRFRITATGAATFRSTAIRALAGSWSYGPLDIDTRYGVLRNTPSRNGNPAAAYAFAQPKLWRSGQLAGFHDPRPINSKIGVNIYTGTGTTDSSFSLFFREGNRDFMTQLDLNGMTMGELDGNPQPDTGAALYGGRPQSDLNVLSQEEIDGISQTALERTLDSTSAHWIEFTLYWGSNPHVEIVDSEGNGYTDLGPFTLDPDSRYLFVAELIDTTARVYIYEIDTTGAITNTVYDSGLIYDSFMLKRLPGRFGWSAVLGDGDAYVENIATRGLVFAEYRTRGLESITPVQGIELFAAGSASRQYFEIFGPYNTNSEMTVTRDRTRSTTGESFKIVNPGLSAIEGVKSNPIAFTDFENAEIYFDLFVPGGSAAPAAFLRSITGAIVPLVINRVAPDQWQTHHASLTDTSIQTGTYQLVIVQNSQGMPSTWWVDNVHVYERTLRWQGRIDPDNPWDETDSGWLDFEDNHNRENGGVMFAERGRKIQVRGQAIDVAAFIDKVKVRPKYAELGRIIDPDPRPQTPPVASFVFTDRGNNVGRFDASASSGSSTLITFEWTFGDGDVGYGPVVDHTYIAPGIYAVTLTVTDSRGNRTTAFQSVTIA